MRRRARSIALALACVLLAASPAVGAPGGANHGGADPRELRQQADQVQVRVDALTRRLDGQLGARDRAVQELGGAVQRAIATEAAADDATQRSSDARGRRARTARALYRSGGPLTVYASVLGSGSVGDALGRVEMAQLVLSAAGRDVEVSEAEADAAAQVTRDADQAAAVHVVTVAEISAATAEIDRTLAEAQAQVDSLEAEASQLEAAEQARAQIEAARQRAAQSGGALGQRVGAQPVPPDYLALYQRAAGRCPGMRWTLLAAVGQVESGHGRNNGPSSAGAVGPMQFMPATFASYGVDGDGDGTADPWNPADAVPTAADYLCEGGGGGDVAQVRRALFRYNRAQWYVDLVLGVEQALVASGA